MCEPVTAWIDRFRWWCATHDRNDMDRYALADAVMRSGAQCAGSTTDFHSTSLGKQRAAARTCTGCRVRAECAAVAMHETLQNSVYGGMTPNARQRLKTEMNATPEPPPILTADDAVMAVNELSARSTDIDAARLAAAINAFIASCRPEPGPSRPAVRPSVARVLRYVHEHGPALPSEICAALDSRSASRYVSRAVNEGWLTKSDQLTVGPHGRPARQVTLTAAGLTALLTGAA